MGRNDRGCMEEEVNESATEKMHVREREGEKRTGNEKSEMKRAKVINSFLKEHICFHKFEKSGSCNCKIRLFFIVVKFCSSRIGGVGMKSRH